MGYSLWCRNIKLTVGKNIDGEALAIGPRGYDFRIDFNILKTATSAKNTAEITIFNLPPSIRESLDSEFDRVLLEVGYEGFTTVLTDGWVDKVIHTRSDNGVNILTVIHCSEGGSDYDFSRISKTYKNGESYRGIVEDIVEKYMSFIKIGDISGILDNYTVGVGSKNRDRNATYAIKELFDEIAENTDSKWSINDRVLDFISNDGYKGRSINTPIISYATGMIGSPKKTEKGVNVDTLIIPNLHVNKLVIIRQDTVSIGRDNRSLIPDSIKARTALEKSIEEAKNDPEKQKSLGILNKNSGDRDIYKISKIHYTGSNYTQEFKAKLTCIRTDGFSVERPKLDRSPVAAVINGETC